VTQVRCQFAAEEQPSPVKPRFHGGNRQPDGKSNFLVGHAFEIAQDYDAFVDGFQLI